jgi:hypothetical protein
MSLGRTLTLGAIGAASIIARAGSAHAILFSFASDDDSSAFTLSGSQGAAGIFHIRNGRTPNSTPVTLDVDDDNGGQPTVHVPIGLLVDLTASYVGSTPIGSAQSHVYSVSGNYSFVHPTTGAPLLQVQVNSGSSALTIIGSNTAWGSAGAIAGSDMASGGANGVNYTDVGMSAYMSSLGFNPALYGFGAFTLEDFGFTMTSANSGGGAITIDAATHLPTGVWGSEASYSGHASLVPTPGAAALGLCGVGLCLRRRRK